MTAAITILRAGISALANPAALLLIAVAYLGGYWRGDARSDARHELANAKAELAVARADQANMAKAAEDARRQAEESRAIAAANETILKDLRNAPKADRCRLSVDDARRLRALR